VRPALDLLRELQKTGDIFFPKQWMDATLSSQRSPEAAAMVRQFLTAHPELPQRLRWVVLNAADDLSRAVKRGPRHRPGRERPYRYCRVTLAIWTGGVG
jgi:hypothetical protein